MTELNIYGVWLLDTISIKTVKRWVHRYRLEKHLNRRPQPGQVRKLNEDQRNVVMQIIEDKPFLNAAVVGRKFGVHKNTIRRIWAEGGHFHRFAARKPKLTEEQKEARMGYALENLTRDWSNVVFSDEKTFQTDRHQRLHVYRPNKSRYNPKYIQERQRSGRISAGYWGWISMYGPGELVAVGGCLNSKGYIEILEDILKPTMALSFGGFKDMIFMQDNCSIHTAKICEKWFGDNADLVRLNTSVNSPDLNPIENVWAEMVREWMSIYPRNLQNLDSVVINIT
ncbi:Transposable element Tcb1 transposase [Pseudolycoriella hygida]|uniref:Transposable element Tcb1 transposase n=1 Tax=Pseudolycoriella hygida TaxID=35572 RepID=A0A9Q0MWK2_9DIPT|nr:Transposable element Tcb1 transposase [Pseudolycoriella hygida]